MKSIMRKKFVVFFLAVCSLLVLGACTTTGTTENFSEYYLLKDISKFSIQNPQPNTPERLWFYRPYIKLLPDLNVYTGSYFSRGEILVAHQIVGESTAAGTVILIHGYNGTSLNTHFQFYAKEFIKRNYRIVLLNLPGHEFSGGKRGDIKDFSDYGTMLHDFLQLTKGQLGENIILIGHSTGAIAIFDTYANYPEDVKDVKATVLLQAYKDVKFSGVYSFGSYFLKDVEVEHQGLLLLNSLPSNWVVMEKEWSEDIESYPPMRTNPILLVYSGEDEVIKTDKSMEYYESKLMNYDLKYYPDQDHVMTLPGYRKMRTETLDWILSQLN